MSEYTQKIKASRIITNANVFVGEIGRMFYDQADGILRLSDGHTPGGIIVGGGGAGTQGPQGITGSQGPQGNQGSNTGSQGPQGIAGLQGNQGASITGPQGNQGNQGNQSSIQGPQGNQGASVTGSQGNQGNQGNTGPTGVNIYGEMTISSASDFSLLVANTWYQMSGIGWNLGDDINQMSGNTSTGALTNNATGSAQAIETLASISLSTTDPGAIYQVAVFKNGNLITEHMAEFLTSTSYQIAVTISGIDTMTTGDVFDLRARSTNTSDTGLNIIRANFSVFGITGPTGNQGNQGHQGNQGASVTGAQGNQGNQGTPGGNLTSYFGGYANTLPSAYVLQLVMGASV